MELATIAAGLGVELYVVDDGWFGGRTSERVGLGDWWPNPDRFPRGLGPLIAEVHRLGMRFGLWMEPEMVNPDSDLYRAHPDWVLHQPHRRRTELRHQLVLNFARPEVARWAHAWLDTLLTDHEIDFLKWDLNRPFTEAGWPGSEDPDRLWFDHTRAVYQLIDRLRADHPRLRIETCASGGGRVDLGILAHTDQAWTSDNTDPAALVAVYQRIRSVVQHGALYRLTDAALEGTTAVQYVSSDGTEAVVLAWRPVARHGQPEPPVRLAGLDPHASYRDVDTDAYHYGAVVLHHGLVLDLPPGDHASTLVHLRRAG